MRDLDLSLLFISLLCAVSGTVADCQSKTFSLLDSEETTYKTCPGLADPDHFTDCCGPSWGRSVSLVTIRSINPRLIIDIAVRMATLDIASCTSMTIRK